MPCSPTGGSCACSKPPIPNTFSTNLPNQAPPCSPRQRDPPHSGCSESSESAQFPPCRWDVTEGETEAPGGMRLARNWPLWSAVQAPVWSEGARRESWNRVEVGMEERQAGDEQLWHLIPPSFPARGPGPIAVCFSGEFSPWFPSVTCCPLSAKTHRGRPVPEIHSVCGEQPPRPGPSPWVCPSWRPLPPATAPPTHLLPLLLPLDHKNGEM